MANSPPWKVYLDGRYIASFKRLLHAGILVSVIGGDTVGRVQVKRNHGKVVYTEGVDGNSADSYDTVCSVVLGVCWENTPHNNG
jgi:hypothetical protein